MKNYIICIFFFYQLLLSISFPRNDQYKFESFNTKNGLSNNSVHRIFQDNDGFLWIGTEYGLNKYDGYSFTNYIHKPSDSNSIGGYTVRDILEDSHGNLWFSTGNTLSILPYKNKISGEFTNYSHPSIWGIEQSKIYPDSLIWICSKNGLHLFDKKRKIFIKYTLNSADSIYLESDLYYNVLEDSEERLWISGSKHKLLYLKNPFSYKPEIRIINNSSEKAKIDYPSGIIYDYFEDSNHNIWFSSFGDGLVKILNGNLISTSFRNYSKSAASKYKIDCDIITNSIIEDKDKNILVSTDCNGIIKISTVTDEITYIKDNLENINRLGSNRIECLFIDREGILWAGSRDNGIIKILNNIPSFERYETQLDNESFKKWKKFDVWRIKKANKGNNYWVGLDHGLLKLKFDKEKFTKLNEYTFGNSNDQNFNNLQIRDFYEQDDSTLWVGTIRLGMIKLNPITKEYQIINADKENPFHPSSENIYCMEKLNTNIWMGFNNGALTSFNPKTKIFKQHYFRNIPSEEYFITSITISKNFPNCFWIGEWNNGLILFNTESNEFKFFHNNVLESESINKNCVTTIYEDYNTIWFGTYGGGLVKGDIADLNNNPKINFKRYDSNYGLNNEMIYAILKDSLDNIWVSTNIGISRFCPETESFTNYTSEDGLTMDGFDLGAGLNDMGKLFFGGSDGIYYFDPISVNNIIEPKIAVINFEKFGKSVFQNSLNNNSFIQLSPNDDFISFEFAALSFSEPEKNQYAYKLVGFTDEWIHIGEKREAVFMNLDPGDYQFKLKASNNHGIWGKKNFTININKSRLFWQTWWFYTSLISIIVITIYIIHKTILVKTIRIREKLQSDLARNFHDDTGGLIASLKINSYNLLKSEDENKELTLRKINEQTSQLSSTVKEILFEIDPNKNSILEFVTYIKKYADSIFEQTNIQFNFENIEPEIENVKLSSNWKVNLLGIFKEGINNIIKHSNNCEYVSLIIKYNQRILEIQLKDDGDGFDKEKITNGNGIKNMKDRAEFIKANLQIESGNGKGTTIKIYGKLT